MKARAPMAILLCALAALTLPAGASAKPGYVVLPKSLHLHVELPAANGYSAAIDTDGHRQVTLRLSKGNVFATYKTLGRVSRTRIEADFGRYGQVSLRFRGRSRFTPQLIPGLTLPKSLRRQCRGRRSVGERGVFLGNVRFEGERGFTRIVAHRAKGKVVRKYKRTCERGLGARASRIRLSREGIVIGATAKSAGLTRFLFLVEFSIKATDDKGREESVAFGIGWGGLSEKVGRVAVVKYGFHFADRDSIEISPRGQTPLAAEVTLPKPFEGTGSYLQEGSAPPTWTGTFGARLPGSGLVPLTGPEFEVELCRSFDERGFDRCLESQLAASPFRAAAPTPSLWRWPGSPR